MAIENYRRKSNTSIKKAPNGALALRQSARPSFVSDPSRPIASASALSLQTRHMDTTIPTSEANSDYRTMFDDPRRVKEWAFTSAHVPVPFLNSTRTELAGPSFGDGTYESNNDLAVGFAVLQSPGQYGVPDGPIMPTSNNMYGNVDGNTMVYTDESLFPDLQFMEDASLDKDFWRSIEHGQPTSADMVYTTSADSYHPGSSDYFEEPQVQSYWASGAKPIDCQSTNRSGEADWSPPSAYTNDLSVASSYSQSSFMYPHASSPQFAPLEDLDSVAPLNDFVQPGIPITGGHQSSYPYEMDTSSTLRAIPGFQRPALSTSTFWPYQEQSQGIASSYMDSMVRRGSEDDRKSSARHNEMYHVRPQEDGLYHCPFEVSDGCTHKPEKLKCNYDKHLDSHLKPYRCKIRTCGTVPFSSTACLLRHEREAHGMHGHGEKPYLCKYDDCDRSIAGNGFPRRWNLQDHMKRVHNNTGPSSTGSASPPPSPPGSTEASKAASNGRKKRTTSSSQDLASKRPKSISSAKGSSKTSKGHTQGKDQVTIQTQWREQHTACNERRTCLDPTDASEYDRTDNDFSILPGARRDYQWEWS